MNFDLREGNLEPIVAALAAKQDDALGGLLTAIIQTRPWETNAEEHLDSIYRTRLRHLFAPRLHVESLVDFARHLNLASSVLAARNPTFAAKVSCYEALVNDAIDEVESGWVDKVLKKKHVPSMLQVLSNTKRAPMPLELLRQRINLEAANMSRVLGLMESAGLVMREPRGSQVVVAATPLGLEIAYQGMTDADAPFQEIKRIGYGSDGSFIDFVGQPDALILDEKGNLVIQARLLQSKLSGAIPNSKLVKFGLRLTPVGVDGWVLFVELLQTAQTLPSNMPPCRVDLAAWRKPNAFEEIQNWINYANKKILEVRHGNGLTLFGGSGIIHRVVNRGTIRCIPGFSMSGQDGGTLIAYKRDWMDEVARVACDVIAKRFPGNKVPKVEWKKWPKSDTWETIFDRIGAPGVHEKNPDRSLDIAFEFLFQDRMRAKRYELVKLGRLSTFTLMYHETNARMQEVIDNVARKITQQGNVTQANPPIPLKLPFDATISAIAKLGFASPTGVPRPQSPPLRICTQISTICANLAFGLCGEGIWPTQNWKLEMTEKDVEKNINSEKLTWVAMCDNPLVEPLRTRWNDEHGRGNLLTQRVLYPDPVEVGLAYPPDDLEWGTVLQEAVLMMLRSCNNDIYNQWLETVAALNKLDIALDDEYQNTIRTGRAVA